MNISKLFQGVNGSHGVPSSASATLLEHIRQASTDKSLGSKKILEMALEAIAQAELKIADQQRTIRRLKQLSTTDELTQMLNRRGFNKIVRRHLKTADRYEETGTFVVCDINDFKAINDRYGHQAGDKVLEEVALYFYNHFRGSDVLGRLGGDEFAILMPRTDLAQARRKIEELQEKLTKRPILWRGHALTIRFSAGFAAYEYGSDENSLYLEADKDLYEHKITEKRRRGRKLELVSSSQA